MIPHPMLSNEIFTNDLKQRVTACRRRVRLSRIHKVHFDNQVGELFPTAPMGPHTRIGHSEDDCSMRDSFVDLQKAETLQGVDGQEVVIT